MNIEQLPPNKPNFGLVVALAMATLLVIFVVAYFTLDWDGKRLVPHHRGAHSTSELVCPSVGALQLDVTSLVAPGRAC